MRAVDPTDIALGFVIRLRRQGLNLSQAALAERCGVSFQQVQKYESGANRVSFSRLVKIAKALNCHVFDLLEAVEQLEAEGAPSDRLLQVMSEPAAIELLLVYSRLARGAQMELVKLLKHVPDKGAPSASDDMARAGP